MPTTRLSPEPRRRPKNSHAYSGTQWARPAPLSPHSPTRTVPTINWECSDAAAELERLCERYGCEPTLNIKTNTAGIVVKHTGASLPDNSDIRWTQLTQQGVLPTRVEACSGYVQIQSKLKLRAVLRDTDGQWKPADDVLYAPDGGWDGEVSSLEDPLLPDNANYSETNAELAKDLWRVWQVDSFADGTLKFGELGEVDSAQDLLPISDELLSVYTSDDGEVGQDAYLLGTTAIPHDPDDAVTNTEDGTRLDIPFTVNSESGFIRTSVAVPKKNTDNAFTEADLFIVCTHAFRDTDTGQYTRYVRFNAPGGVGGVFTARRFDIRPQFTGQYDDDNDHTKLTGTTDNANEVNTKLDDELSIILEQQSPRPAIIREYNGIQQIAPDGAIRSVMFVLDSQRRSDDRNCITIAFHNVSGGPIVYDKERRRHQLSTLTDADWDRNRVHSIKENRRRQR